MKLFQNLQLKFVLLEFGSKIKVATLPRYRDPEEMFNCYILDDIFIQKRMCLVFLLHMHGNFDNMTRTKGIVHVPYVIRLYDDEGRNEQSSDVYRYYNLREQYMTRCAQ